MRSNPIFRTIVFPTHTGKLGVGSMTLNGTIYRGAFLLACATASGLWSWAQFHRKPFPLELAFLTLFSLVAAPLLVWFTVRKKQRAVITAPVYALAEGLVLGMLAALLDSRYPGIAFQATALTFAICAFMLLLLRTGFIRVTQRFNSRLVAATGGIALYYFSNLVLIFVGLRPFSFFAGGVPGILFSVFVVSIAALNLVSDFDLIVRCTKSGLPKYMEWYTALGVIVTLVWLWIETLQLLAKARKAEEQPG